MFIHRESFLESFFNDSSNCNYCSVELVYAIAANGARLADRSEELYSRAREYYYLSKKSILDKMFELEDTQPSKERNDISLKVTELQTLLCLAFYDIGNGKDSMGWYLSGLSFRIAHEVGLQLDPKNWNDSDNGSLKVRSRRYWGCFIADHLICLLFGRTAQLRLSNSTIPETNDLPDVENGIEEYQFTHGKLLIAEAMKHLIILSRITEVFYQAIFMENSSIEKYKERKHSLTKFNIEVFNRRKKLPVEFFWDRRAVELSNTDPTVTYFWHHYYIVLLSFNKPFIGDMEQSRIIVHEVMEDVVCLLINFRREFQANHNKCNLYMIYATILSLECLNSMKNVIKGYPDSMGLDDNKLQEETTVLKNFLNSSSGSYKLSKDFVDNEMKMNSVGLIDFMSRDYLRHYDLNLLREIDKLISESKRSPADFLSFSFN